MSKSPDAFRTISEVAEWLGIPAHVLRFWESKFTQIKPVKRAGGRRYYRPADMKLLGGIKRLLHDEGKSIKEVQAMLRDQGVGRVAKLSGSLEESADQMVVIDTFEPVVDIAIRSEPTPSQIQMDLGAQQQLDDSVPVDQSEAQPALAVTAQIEEPQLPPASEQPLTEPVQAVDAVADIPASAEVAAPKIVEVTAEDTADDALVVDHAGILTRLAGVTSLAQSSLEQVMVCADQLRSMAGRQNNISAN